MTTTTTTTTTTLQWLPISAASGTPPPACANGLRLSSPSHRNILHLHQGLRGGSHGGRLLRLLGGVHEGTHRAQHHEEGYKQQAAPALARWVGVGGGVGFILGPLVGVSNHLAGAEVRGHAHAPPVGEALIVNPRVSITLPLPLHHMDLLVVVDELKVRKLPRVHLLAQGCGVGARGLERDYQLIELGHLADYLCHLGRLLPAVLALQSQVQLLHLIQLG
mmetsp:Transcript_38433/g.87995  ORF Transcript_38433/g.87995 Transcript_38433/m.87995 type:complete len:220 (-) Transcript_38433:367-1026(-)